MSPVWHRCQTFPVAWSKLDVHARLTVTSSPSLHPPTALAYETRFEEIAFLSICSEAAHPAKARLRLLVSKFYVALIHSNLNMVLDRGSTSRAAESCRKCVMEKETMATIAHNNSTSFSIYPVDVTLLVVHIWWRNLLLLFLPYSSGAPRLAFINLR